ncbi:MAG: hypothetical protein QXQ39_07495, partial [Conexivisphaerales archaeon]
YRINSSNFSEFLGQVLSIDHDDMACHLWYLNVFSTSFLFIYAMIFKGLKTAKIHSVMEEQLRDYDVQRIVECLLGSPQFE